MKLFDRLFPKTKPASYNPADHDYAALWYLANWMGQVVVRIVGAQDGKYAGHAWYHGNVEPQQARQLAAGLIAQAERAESYVKYHSDQSTITVNNDHLSARLDDIGDISVTTKTGSEITLDRLNDLLEKNHGAVLVVMVEKGEPEIIDAWVGKRDGSKLSWRLPDGSTISDLELDNMIDRS